MPNVAAVRLTYNPKVLWFDPNGVEFAAGDALIVRTERGLEYGIADEDLKKVEQKALNALKCALKPVVRKATPEDAQVWKEMQDKAAEALPVFKQMVAEHKLDMHPVTVEFLFDGDKAVFYFEAEDRVDFRELVRSLARAYRHAPDRRARRGSYRGRSRTLRPGTVLQAPGRRVQPGVHPHGERPGPLAQSPEDLGRVRSPDVLPALRGGYL